MCDIYLLLVIFLYRGFNLDFVMGFLDFYFVVDFSLILYDDFDELLRLDRVGFVFDQNDYLGKFEKQ